MRARRSGTTKGATTRSGATALDLEAYLRATRGITVSVAYLLPLLAAYEVGVSWLGTDLRNSAEVSLKQFAGLFGGSAIWIQRVVLLVVLVVAVRLARKDVPALRIYPVFLLESLLFALLLGPLVSLLVGGTGLKPDPGPSLAERLLLSIGAGVYEELVFRFLLLAGGFSLLHKGLGLARGPSFGIALAVSALLFSAYHHVGPAGEPFRAGLFGFRAAAGVVLGIVFAGRGLALCAYLHAFYDIFCDLHAAGATA
jgi:hypothetical protein